MKNERRKSLRTALALCCLLLAGCRREPHDEAAGVPALSLGLTASAANDGRALPREFAEAPLGLGMTVGETLIRLPDLTPDPSLDFAAPPTYYVCDEITVTHDYILSRARNAVTLHARPGGDLGSIELYALDGEIAAGRGLYAESYIRKVPYREFVARALKRYGASSRSESLGYSDGTIVRYTLWQNQQTTILIGETDAPKEAPASRYIYFIDGGLLRDSYRAAAEHGLMLPQPRVL